MNVEGFVKSIVASTDSAGRIKSRERNDLEFKETYRQKNWPKYVKTMTGFANNRGGCIFFGIKDNPREIIGISEEFGNLKQEASTEFLNSLFAPEIQWEMGIVEFDGKEIGYIYTEEAAEKPIIAQKE